MVTIYSDSQYLVSAITEGWVERWKSRNWWRTNKEQAINVDLWEKLLTLCQAHEVNFICVKGQNDNPENERCDKLSYAALRKKDLPPDELYENLPPAPEPVKNGTGWATLPKMLNACYKVEVQVIQVLFVLSKL